MADALSQGDFCWFRAVAVDMGVKTNVVPEAVPRALRQWLVLDDDLGQRILREMSGYTPLLGYNNL